MDQEYVFYYSPLEILKGLPCNAGIDKALERIEDLRRQGLKVRVVDIAGMSEAEQYAIYTKATTPAIVKKCPIRQVFGSRRHSAFMFGRGVPTLVVQTQSGEVADVFPHEESGHIVTILEFLSHLPAAV